MARGQCVSGALATVLCLCLAGCAADLDQARLCRSLIPAFEAQASEFETLSPEAARAAGYDVKIAFRALDEAGRERAAWIACRFAGEGRDRLTLIGVATDRLGALGQADLFWLQQWRDIYAREDIDPRQAPAWARDTKRPSPDDPLLPLLYFGQQLINAAALAGVYVLLALSFTLVYGLIGRINFAFGELYMMGAVLSGVWLAALAVFGLSGWGTALAVVLLPCLGTIALFGWVMGRLVFRPLHAARGHAPLIAAIGLSIVLQEAVRLLHGARDVWVPADYGLSFTLAATTGFDLVANWKQAALLALTVAAVLGLVAYLQRSRFGLAYRACADDPGAAALLGVDAGRVLVGTFALGGALAGLAGFALLQYYGVANFFMGFLTGFKALTAAILGGIGSIPGAVLGGALIAILETFWSGYLGAAYKDVAVFAVLALVLVFRPGGLMGVETARISQPDRA